MYKHRTLIGHARREYRWSAYPHRGGTLAVTTLSELSAGARVNLEIDLIARYVERMLTADNE